jgi:hypothetical protein
VPARLIFHVIKIGRSTRAGKATAMANGLNDYKHSEQFKYEIYTPNINFKRQILIYCFGEYMNCG